MVIFMYVLISTWQIRGYIEKSQETFEKYDELSTRVSALEPFLIGDESFKLINVEIFYTEINVSRETRRTR